MLAAHIREDMKTAMRAKDALRLQTLRGALAAFTNELVSKGRKPTDELTDAEATLVVKRLCKQRSDSAEQFTKGGRPELAAKETAERGFLELYLPKTVSEEEIEKVAKKKMSDLAVGDAAGAGKLIGAILKEFAGTADGADVKRVVGRLLS